MIKTFRDNWLEEFYFQGIKSSHIPESIEGLLNRRLDLIHAANEQKDLMGMTSNRPERLYGQFEHIYGAIEQWCAIRLNEQYRVIFRFEHGEATSVFLHHHPIK